MSIDTPLDLIRLSIDEVKLVFPTHSLSLTFLLTTITDSSMRLNTRAFIQITLSLPRSVTHSPLANHSLFTHHSSLTTLHSLAHSLLFTLHSAALNHSITLEHFHAHPLADSLAHHCSLSHLPNITSLQRGSTSNVREIESCEESFT
jgi:hypothetical protein